MKSTRCHGKAGFTLIEIMVVVAIIGLLAAIAVPNFIRARATAQANACINNLRIIGEACDQWALETGQVTGAPCLISVDLSPYIKVQMNGQMPVCPAGGNYSSAGQPNDHLIVGDRVVCSLGNTVTPAHVMP